MVGNSMQHTAYNRQIRRYGEAAPDTTPKTIYVVSAFRILVKPMPQTNGVRSLAMGAILFSAGMCSADTIRYRIANARAQSELPHATIEYNTSGTYVNGERVRKNGLIGAPRCELDSMTFTAQRDIAVQVLQKQPRVIGDYAAQVGERAWRSLMYQTIKQGVDEDSLRARLPSGSYQK